MPLNRRRSGEPRTAAVVAASDLRGRLRSSAKARTWQQKVIRYDREGPSVAGYYLDTVQLLATLCPLIGERREADGTWSRVNDPVVTRAIASFSSPMYSTAELFALPVRHLDAIGESWVMFSADIGWCVATVPNVKIIHGGNAVEFTDPYGLTRRVPKERAFRLWTQDPYEPWLPTSAMQRALPDLRRLDAACRNQTRSAESRLIMNGLVAFPPDEGPTRALGQPADGRVLTGVEKTVDDFITIGQEAFNDDDSPAASMPFPYIGGKAEYVQVGRPVDEYVLEVEKAALEAFARGVNFPAQLLTVGPGSANHWNEWILQEVQHKMGLAPKLRPVCDALTTIFLRPMLERIKDRVTSWDLDPSEIRLGFDLDFLTSKPDQSAQALQAWAQGIVGREGAAQMLKVPESWLLPIPDGMTEYEHWELATGSKGAPYAEVDGDGKLIVPPPDPGMGGDPGMGMDPYGGDPGMGEDPSALDEAPPDGSDDLFSAPYDPPRARMSAASDPNRLNVLLAELVIVDDRLTQSLSGVSRVLSEAITVEAVKEGLRAMDRDDPLRAELRELPSRKAWQELPDEVKAQVDTVGVAERTAAKYEGIVSGFLAEAAADAERAWTIFGVPAPEFLVTAGTTAFLVATVDAAAGFLGGVTVGPLKATLDAAQAGLLTAAVVGLLPVRAAMVAAAGARVDLDGRVVQSPGGTPYGPGGGPWEGALGMALGDPSIAQIRTVAEEEAAGTPPGGLSDSDTPSGGEPGSGAGATPGQPPGGARTARVQFRWAHGFFGNPETPFPPHEALDGRRFDSLADVPYGLYPGDHAGCRCAFLPEIKVV